VSEQSVVVLKDEGNVALHLMQQLSKLGYNVIATAASGENALAQVRTLHPDVVLKDIHTEGPIEGLETAMQIASEIQLPVIYVTAYSEDATLERVRQTKPYGFLVKPFSERELHATIQIALERRRFDAILQSSEMQLKRERDIAQRYLDVAGVIILVLDVEGKVTLINQRGVDILQYRDPEEIIGKAWIDSFIPDRLRDEMRQAHSSLIGGEAVSIEFYVNPVLTRNGEERIIEWHNAILTDEHGRLSGSLSSGEDITERQRAMDALRLSEERFRSIFSAVSEGILIVDAETRTFIDVNEPGAAMFGYGPGELHGRDIETLSAGIPPGTRREVVDWIQKAADSGQPQRFEWHCKARDGGLFWADVAVRSASIGNQDVVLAVVRDTTERHAIEAQLRQAQKMEAIGNLTGGIAHDFNNLLGIIIGNLDLLRDLVESREMKELAHDALEAGLRGADLTQRLLTFARRQPLQPQRIEVNDLVANITRLLARTLGEDIEITVDPARDLWPVVADPAQLEAAITNLATNARDAMAKGGRLKIATRNTRLREGCAAVHAEVAPGDYIVIEVSDTGTGIEPASLDHIFEPFFTTKEIGKGTGLGLSIVFGFIRQSGGYVTVDSKLGAGTTFRLCLPRTVESAPAFEANTEEPAPRGGETIVVVEDNPALRRIVMKQLAELGYRVIPAENAMAALTAFDAAQDIDLLLTDVVMPGGVDGTELAQQLRARRPKLKVLLTSGFAAARVGEISRELNWPLLSKPYRKTDLARAVREILDA
jgi:PAS domain S-box-containing protein